MFFLILLLKLSKENLLRLFLICGCYDSVHDACFWRDNQLSYCKAFFSDSGQSIYLALSHFICKTTALRTAAQNITSKDLYKIPVKDFLFVSIHHKNFPSAFGLYSMWSTIFLHSDWRIYCPHVRLVQHLAPELVTGSLFWMGYLKKLNATVRKIVQRAVSIGTNEHLA